MNTAKNRNWLGTPRRQRSQKDAEPASVFLMIDDLQTGGSERQFAALARALCRDSFRVGLGCMRRKGAFLEGMDDIAEFDVGGSFFTLQAQRAYFALARHLRLRRVAVAHSFDFYSNLMLIPVARLAGVPVVIGSQRQLGDLLTGAKRRVQSAVFRLCDRVVCNSRAAADRLLDQGLSESKLVVIPNGLPPRSVRAGGTGVGPATGSASGGLACAHERSGQEPSALLARGRATGG